MESEGQSISGESKEEIVRNLKVVPGDIEWKFARQRFLHLLRTEKTVQHILETEFSYRDRILFIPSSNRECLLFRTQYENTKKYKALLADGGQFAGCYDNLATKLTMLKFGFPVSPITMNNIFNRKTNPEDHDPEDNWKERNTSTGIAPEVFGNPLQFLDEYSDRNYGINSLRSE